MERFLDYFAPERYRLEIDINPAKTHFRARAIIAGQAKSEQIKFHAVNLVISRILIDDQIVESYQYEDGVLIFSELALGEHEIVVDYEAEISTSMEGVYLSEYECDHKKRQIVATQFESHYARRCFPCVDEPSAKAQFSLKISSDSEDVILSNMPVRNSFIQADRKTCEFETTPRMSSYLVAFVVGPLRSYQTKSRHGIKITSYAGLHQSEQDLVYSANFAAEALDFYDDLFKTPYPLPKLDLVALPDFEAGAMENWGLTTYREIAMLANESSSYDQRLYVDIVIAHELSHMWFGDLVTMAWWDDLWLNESFANMIEIYAVDKIHPELNAWDDFYTSSIMAALRRDCLPAVQPVKVNVEDVNDIENLFDGAIVYAKGARLLLMLMRTIGEQKFFDGLADYFKKHAYRNTTAEDLWHALTPYADFDVANFMTPWLTQSGYPVITAGKQQRRFLLSGDMSASNYPIQKLRDDLSGHYLIKLSDSELKSKLQRLDSLNKEQKLRLIIDQRLLAKTNFVKSASLITLIERFDREIDPVIWEAISATINDLKIFFDKGSPEEQNFKLLVSEISDFNYRRLGITSSKSDDVDDIRLRPIIMALKRYAGDSNFLEDVALNYQSRSISEIDNNLRWVVLSALVLQDNRNAQDYYNIYTTTHDVVLKSDLMDAITTTHSQEIAEKYLQGLKNGEIRPQDRLSFFIRLARNRELHERAIRWFYQNWAWLKEVEGNKTAPDYPRYLASTILTPAAANTFIDFFKSDMQNNIYQRNITVAQSEIASQLKLIESDKDDVLAIICAKKPQKR